MIVTGDGVASVGSVDGEAIVGSSIFNSNVGVGVSGSDGVAGMMIIEVEVAEGDGKCVAVFSAG